MDMIESRPAGSRQHFALQKAQQSSISSRKFIGSTRRIANSTHQSLRSPSSSPVMYYDGMELPSPQTASGEANNPFGDSYVKKYYRKAEHR
ncbi:hypothetical protein pipiens_008237 [Culex pipiens pipiens]|uniref:Uncharacterized protein n=1 Tax=Culex pipiens pipiens TaxID=38569 RepID=A0ABD1DI71_CULPP